jgi:hypothetical protein
MSEFISSPISTFPWHSFEGKGTNDEKREGKRENSEKFVSIKFLGYSFLYSAFTADYDFSANNLDFSSLKVWGNL